MKHPNAQLLNQIYSDFAKGDMKAVLAACADGMTFQVSGKSKLAGKYTKQNFATDYVAKQRELSGDTFKIETHDILANDRHAVVLASEFIVRGGEQVQMRTAHVWRFEGGKPVAWYGYPRDLYQFDATWS